MWTASLTPKVVSTRKVWPPTSNSGRKKPGAGPGPYRGTRIKRVTFLLMDRWAKEEEKGGGVGGEDVYCTQAQVDSSLSGVLLFEQCFFVFQAIHGRRLWHTWCSGGQPAPSQRPSYCLMARTLWMPPNWFTRRRWTECVCVWVCLFVCVCV